jgi:hypothetical protein
VVIDGTRAFLYRRTLQNAADASALAGAAELDRAAYYSTGGQTVAVQEDAARRAAGEWLHKRGLGAPAVIDVSGVSVRVALRDEIATTFLGIAGIDALPVAAEASAEPRPGRL